MHRIADHFHLVVPVKQEGLECDVLRKFVQFVAFQDVPQLTVVFRLEDEDERDAAVCCRIDMGDQFFPFRQLQFATGATC